MRFYSAARVVDDIELLHRKYGCQFIVVADDLATVNKKRMTEIRDLLKIKGLSGHLEFSVQARANVFDEQLCEILKGINVTDVAFGIESGSQRILEYLKGNTVTIEQNRRAIQLALSHGFRV
ncbi:MAG: radical SAM protein [Candidatus Woesearchaeota archaeon]